MISGVLHLVSGVAVGIAVSWFAANVLSDYNNPLTSSTGGVRYVYGDALFVGWVSSSCSAFPSTCADFTILCRSVWLYWYSVEHWCVVLLGALMTMRMTGDHTPTTHLNPNTRALNTSKIVPAAAVGLRWQCLYWPYCTARSSMWPHEDRTICYTLITCVSSFDSMIFHSDFVFISFSTHPLVFLIAFCPSLPMQGTC